MHYSLWYNWSYFNWFIDDFGQLNIWTDVECAQLNWIEEEIRFVNEKLTLLKMFVCAFEWSYVINNP